MAQSVRERIPELAVLKTLGFTDAAVLMMVLTEALLICLLGALIGMGLAALVLTGATKALQLPLAPGDLKLWLQALGTAVALSIAVGVLPAWRARTLKIVDALAGR